MNKVKATRRITAGEVVSLGQNVVASDGPVLVTIPNVPICATGIEYPLSSGPATFTTDDLIDAAQSQDDPAIQSPRLGIGHIDPRYNGPEFDGTPAFGKFVNLRVVENGQLLIADIAGCPKWLADIAPVAFPNRSIEGNMEVETVTGHEWRLVIWSVKLLGVLWPGVSTLSDLPLYYGENMPEDVVIVDPEEDDEVGASIKATRGRPGSVSASVNVEDVRRAYYDSLDGAQLWWWIRAMYLDPNELIVDDDDGNLYRVPFAVADGDGEDAVTFEDPIKVKMTFVDAKSGDSTKRQAVALVAAAGREVASYTNRVASRPDNNEEKEKTVDPVIIQSLRAQHGLSETDLPDDATEEQIKAAIEAATVEPDDVEDDEEEAPQVEPNNAELTEPVAAGQLPPGMVAVPADEWKRVQQGLQAATKHVEEDDKVRRQGIVEAAVTAGKIRPADRQSYQNGLDNPATRTQFETLLTASVDKGGLAPNIVPVHERGAGSAPGASVEASTGGGDGYDESWLSPQERARVTAARAGTLTPEPIHVEKGA